MSTETIIRAVDVICAHVPQELKTRKNWVCFYRERNRFGKMSNAPYLIDGALHASSTNPADWSTFDDAVDAQKNFNGVTFMLTGTPYLGFDFDGVVRDRKLDLYVASILQLMDNPYCEISPSGTGLRTFVACPCLPKPKGTQFKSNDKVRFGVEIYHGEWGAKALTVTGARYSGTEITSIKSNRFDLIYLLCSQICNDKFKALWMGNYLGYPSQSEADLALCRLLVKLLGPDSEKIDAAFRFSGLYRDKWDRDDYSGPTIAKAIELERARNNRSTQPTETERTGHQLEFHLPAVTTGTHRDYVIAPVGRDKDGWFPLGDPSLIGGSSGASKTTLMIQLLRTQASKTPFLGHETYGRPHLILMADRGENAQKRTLERMHLLNADGSIKDEITIKYLPPVWGIAASQAIIEKIEETRPLPEIVFIEGCDMLVMDANKMEIVTRFMKDLQAIAEHFHAAIIGSVGAPKFKQGQGYTAKRDNLTGSAAWGRNCETVALLQFPKGDDTSIRRELSVLPRNGQAESFSLILNDGLLEIENKGDAGHDRQERKEIQWFKERAGLAKEDPTKKWWTILDVERALKVPHSTVDRWIKDACARKYIVKKTGGRNGRGRGAAAQFRWNESETNPLWVAEQDCEVPNTVMPELRSEMGINLST